MYNDVIFVFIVFYVDPASGPPYSINQPHVLLQFRVITGTERLRGTHNRHCPLSRNHNLAIVKRGRFLENYTRTAKTQ